MMITHTDLVKMLQHLKLVTNNQKGVCNGVAHLWYWYAANHQEQEYYQIMDDISAYWKEGLLSDSSKLEALGLNPSADEKTMRLYQFLRLIAVLQKPDDYANDYENFGLTGWNESPYGSKISNVRFQYLDSLLIKNSAMSRQAFYTQQECHTQVRIHKAFGDFGMRYLVDYFSMIETHVSSGNVVISIVSSDAAHAIGCRYDAQSGQWTFFDANLLGRGIEKYQAIDKTRLVSSIKERLAALRVHNAVLTLSLHSQTAENVEICRSNLSDNLNQLSEQHFSDRGYTIYHNLLSARKYEQIEQLLTQNTTTSYSAGGFRPTMGHNSLKFVQNSGRFDNGLLIPRYTTTVHIRPAAINARDPFNLNTPLMTLIKRGKTGLALEVIQRDDVDLSVTQSLPQPGLFPTADAPVDKYTKDKYFVTGMTALMLACLYANTEVVKAILQRYPDGATQSDNRGNSALHYAVRGGSIDCVQLIVRTLMPGSAYIRDHTKKFQAMFLRFPSQGGANESTFSNLHQKMMVQSVNQVGGRGYTALHLACEREEYSIVECLLHHPMLSLNLENEEGLTPLQLANKHNEGDALRILLLGDARININQAMGDEGSAPILWLFDKCADPFVGDMSRRLLIDLLKTRTDIDMSVTDAMGNNLLQYAIKANDTDLVTLILEKFDIDINHQNNEGQTALHFAIRKKQAIIDALCLHNGIEDKSNIDGLTACELAETVGDDGFCMAFNINIRHCA